MNGWTAPRPTVVAEFAAIVEAFRGLVEHSKREHLTRAQLHELAELHRALVLAAAQLQAELDGPAAILVGLPVPDGRA